MVEYRIKVTQQASEQLKTIRNYIENELNAPVAAKNLLIFFKQKIEQLTYMPQRYQTIDEKLWSNKEIRKISVKNYYIYYWIDEAKKTVYILAIIYSKRDQNQQLLEVLNYKVSI